jgi:predicted MFS family arabinose efflux permease
MGLAADRWGQRPVLLLAVTLNVLALLALALIPGLSRPGLLGLCALVGLSLPQVGGMARARWLALTRRHTDTAMAYEGTADEVAYVLGPAVAGLLASLWGAPAALLAAALTGLLGVGAFALHPTHAVTRRGHGTGRSQPTAEPNAAPPAERTADPNAEWTAQRTGEPSAGLFRLVLVPVLAMLLMGAFFAAVQSALTVYAGTVGHPAAGGLIYALMAVGSAGTALGTAALPACFGPGLRCAVSAFGLLLGVLTMATTIATSGPVPVLCAAVLFTGLSVGPILVTLNQVVGERAPVRRSATAMAYLSAGTMVGIALGATSAGALADTSGSLGAFAVAAAASTALLLLALTGLRRPRQ